MDSNVSGVDKQGSFIGPGWPPPPHCIPGGTKDKKAISSNDHVKSDIVVFLD
jgi:hypothetical protein